MTGTAFPSSSSTAVITKTRRLMPGAPESLKGLRVLSLRHPDCHTGFQEELKHLFAGLLKPELQVINPRPQEQTVRIRQWKPTIFSCLFFFVKRSTLYPELAWNSLCGPGWPSQVSIRIEDASHHAWFPLTSLEKYVLNFICDGSRRSYDSQSQSELGLYILKDKSQG